MTTVVLTAVSNGIRGLWTVAPCRWVVRYQFRRTLPLPSSRHYLYGCFFKGKKLKWKRKKLKRRRKNINEEE